jgi:hypothetical protein
VPLAIVALVLLLMALTLPNAALADRGNAASPRAGHPYAPRRTAAAITVQEATLDEALACLIGPDVQVSKATMTAAAGTVGLFSGAAGIIGIGDGLILSSGNIVTLVGPNIDDATSYDNAYPGDPDLDGLIPGYTTFDATILEFDFECDDPTVISFQYVFASEEYNEWVGSPYNDVFGFFLNGQNIAAVPDVCSNPGLPVAINNVDCEFPYNPPHGPNCDCYRNNDLDDLGGLIDTEMDGVTQVFYASAQILPGTNHMKLAIADAGDPVYDSNVMIRCQTFTCMPPPEIGACCFRQPGDDCFMISREQCEAAGGLFLGEGTSCSTEPCEDSVLVAVSPGVASLALDVKPSPSVGTVTVSYAIPEEGVVVLEVYDVSGALVRRLESGLKTAWPHTSVWHGEDDHGRALAAGVYFVRVRIGARDVTRRVVLVK